MHIYVYALLENYWSIQCVYVSVWYTTDIMVFKSKYSLSVQKNSQVTKKGMSLKKPVWNPRWWPVIVGNNNSGEFVSPPSFLPLTQPFLGCHLGFQICSWLLKLHTFSQLSFLYRYCFLLLLYIASYTKTGHMETCLFLYYISEEENCSYIYFTGWTLTIQLFWYRCNNYVLHNTILVQLRNWICSHWIHSM